MKRIGHSFYNELVVAGLSGISLSWGDDGRIIFGDEVTQDEKDRVGVVLNNHAEPPPPDKSNGPLTAEELANQMIADGTMTQGKINAIKAAR